MSNFDVKYCQVGGFEMIASQLTLNNSRRETEMLAEINAKLRYLNLVSDCDDMYKKYCAQEKETGDEPFPKEQIVFLQSSVSTRDEDEIIPRHLVKQEAQQLFAHLKANDFGKSAVVTQIGFEPKFYIVDNRIKKTYKEKSL